MKWNHLQSESPLIICNYKNKAKYIFHLELKKDFNVIILTTLLYELKYPSQMSSLLVRIIVGLIRKRFQCCCIGTCFCLVSITNNAYVDQRSFFQWSTVRIWQNMRTNKSKRSKLGWFNRDRENVRSIITLISFL